MVNIVLLQRLQLIAVCQIIQHLFYYITWDKSQLAKKVISWSSLEWQRLPQKTSLTTGLFETVGTIFDLMVHLVNAYLLASQITAVEVILGIALVHFTVQILLYNPRFAWTSPNSLEPWIEKRLKPLSKDLVPHTPGDKLIGAAPISDDILNTHNESFKAKQQ